MDSNAQKEQWFALAAKVDQLVQQVSVDNIRETVVQLFKDNLVRGRGVFARSVLRSQSRNPALMACLVCVINSKMPEVGRLVVVRAVEAVQRRLEGRDCEREVVFVAHLVNYQVCHEVVVLEVLYELLKVPSNKSVSIACVLLTHCGLFLQTHAKTAADTVFERLRGVLSEGVVTGKAARELERLLELRRKGFRGHPVVEERLDLVEEEDKITHSVDFGDKLDIHPELDRFVFDERYAETEAEYAKLRVEILGEEETESEEEEFPESPEPPKEEIRDLTEQELTTFQKTVYLTVMGSMGPEEAAHKLLHLKPVDAARHEHMVVDMVVKCCAQEKSYSKFYGLVGEQLIVLGPRWEAAFSDTFTDNYNTCHRFEASLLRNIGTFWGHLLASDKMGWEVLAVVQLTQHQTNSARRILLKFLFGRLQEELGQSRLAQRLTEEYIRPYLQGMFPEEDAEHMRFAINFFTAIGLGRLTEGMRGRLEEVVEKQRGRWRSRSGSDSRSRSGSYSSYSSSGSSRSSSRSRSYSRSRSGSPNRSRTRSPRSRNPATNANAVPLGKR